MMKVMRHRGMSIDGMLNARRCMKVWGCELVAESNQLDIEPSRRRHLKRCVVNSARKRELPITPAAAFPPSLHTVSIALSAAPCIRGNMEPPFSRSRSAGQPNSRRVCPHRWPGSKTPEAGPFRSRLRPPDYAAASRGRRDGKRDKVECCCP